jgi:endoglucanase
LTITGVFSQGVPVDGYVFEMEDVNPLPPPGAVSGGPNTYPSDPDALDAGVMDEAPSKRYVDVIGSYSSNEVAINWDAPLAWVLTYLNVMSE